MFFDNSFTEVWMLVYVKRLFSPLNWIQRLILQMKYNLRLLIASSM